jgi:phospholipid transport system substrate-binding protein
MKGNPMALHRLIFACAAFLVGALVSFSAKADQNTPQQVVEKSYTVLLGIMKEARTLGYEGRFERLAPAVEATFDLPYMAKRAAGSYWDKASDDQRQRYVEAFGRMTTASLATRFEEYKGERFEMLGTEEKSPTSVLVKTRLVETDGHTVPIDYVMQNLDGSWKVTDIFTMGSVSEVAVKTADYAAVLRNGGIDALAGALDNKVVALAEEEKQSEGK